jgi:glutathione S-transferase
MKLHWSPRSPFVRKVAILLHETNQLDKVELVRSVAAIATPNAALMQDNPLSQIPTLVCGTGHVLYDSPVICEYLDTLHDGQPFFPSSGAGRWLALRRQALGDGMLSILLLWRQERMKTVQQQLPTWLASFETKINASLDSLEKEAASLANGDFDIGHVTIGCMLSYLDYRFADIDWRTDRPLLSAWHQDFCRRPSVIATVPDDTAA